MRTQTLNRRSFLKASALAGGGLMLGFHAIAKSAEAELADEIFAPNAFLKIDTNGVITLMSPNPEVGQGIKTSMPMLVAEELEADWRKVIVEQTPLDTRLYTRQVA